MFLAKQPERLKRIQAQAKRPLKDAAAVNSTRWALVNSLKTHGLAFETASGRFNIQTSHGLFQGVSHRYCTVVQRGDVYGYSQVAKTDVIGTLPGAVDASHPALYLPALMDGVSRAFR